MKMSSVNKNKFRSLIGRYMLGQTTSAESDAVEKYYSLFEDEPDKIDQMTDEQSGALHKRMKEKIAEGIRKQQRGVFPMFKTFYISTAAAMVLIGSFVIYLYSSGSKSDLSKPVAEVIIGEKVASADKNHFVTLPDGTKVVLRGNSRITYNADFNKISREVNLTGEAYFDVVHLSSSNKANKAIPFIITTGKVKTTVLGTAFNIKAWPDQKEVTVTVARGKVKVQDDAEKVTFLTANKQLTLNTGAESTANVKTVESDQATNWTQADMIFDGVAFGELASKLEQRYDVKITFRNPAISDCAITGRFSGTESLDEVFQILSLTSNTAYYMKNGELVVDGEKCH